MKRGRRPNRKHINELPDNLVENILMCLPIQDAVRTSILSRKWRYAWTKLPKLVFNDEFCEESILNTKSKLIMAIYQVLLLHKGPLREFDLSLSYLESNTSEIDQFVLVALTKEVKDLHLRFPKDEAYILPSSIFSYGQQLEHLELLSCVFKPPPRFEGFSNVHSLVLDEVSISSRRFSSIISNCPVLEHLSFETSISYERIDIVAPNLKSIKIMFLCRPLCFKKTPNLATVIIHAGQEEDGRYQIKEAPNQPMLSGKLPGVEILALDNFCMKFVTSNQTSRSLVKDLSFLRILHFWDVSFGIIDNVDDVFAGFSIIRNSPNLEMLQIDVYTDAASELDITYAEDVSLDHLKRVDLRQVSGLKSELQFIELILAKSPVLEKFIIEPGSGLIGYKEFEFLKELSRFRRASPLVEIAYEG